ncbi:peptide-methionine (R)-S-oxide reductase, partial [Ralstonia insidiosa]
MSKIDKPLDSWREELTEEQFHICRLGGTERAFSGEYHATKTPGIYH